MIIDDGPQPLTEDILRRKVAFPRQHGPLDYFKLRGKAMRYLMLGTIIIGQVTLGLWCKQERLIGAQRQYTYVERTVNGRKYAPEILVAWSAFGTSGTYGRDQYLPGWNTGNNVVDCIGGGGGGGGAASSGYGGGGGGGGGLARYSNVGALGPTFSMAIGGGGGGGGGNGGGGPGGNTQLDGWVGAYGGGGGASGGGGGAGGTYYAGTGYYPGGSGGAGNINYTYYGGGGGGAAGYYGGGSNGSNGVNPLGYGGNGGPVAGGAGGGSQGAAGGNGTEYGPWGSGGGGAGSNAQNNGGNGGYYGGGGGGGQYFYAPYGGGNGAQGLLMISYVPLTAPVVSSCSPSSGPTAGGQYVTISGSGFFNVASVNIGGAPLTSISVPNQYTINGYTSAGGAGTYNVNVIVTGGVAAGAGGSLYSYVNPPAVYGCAPTFGLTLGGTAITINGANFAGTSSVTIGGAAATNISQVNANTITCLTPAHAPGLANIIVNGAYGSGSVANAFNYVLPASGFNMPMV